MIKILTSKQIQAIDAITITREPISSSALMERACSAFVDWFVRKFPSKEHVIGIVCGGGNNGGDGYGIARMLFLQGYAVKVYALSTSSKSPDNQMNAARLTSMNIFIEDTAKIFDEQEIKNVSLWIDALFGSGLTKPLSGASENVVKRLNATNALRIAVDIPSGLFSDQPTTTTTFKAHHTVTFQLPKLALLFPQHGTIVGKLHRVDIGLHEGAIQETPTQHFLLTANDIKTILKSRGTFDHKGTFGHGLIIAGSKGRMGASVLAARAALRSGVGLLSVQTPACGVSIMQTSLPEAMVLVDQGEDRIQTVFSSNAYACVGIGPGLGKHEETVKFLGTFLAQQQWPLVLDADALNILADHRAWLHYIPKGSILTPHPKEFERLVGPWQNDFHRLEKLKQLAKQLNCVVVLKGAFTSIANSDGVVYFNSTGNPGMATGGSGDVLTGILTSLIAQGYTPLEAALIGVYVHGLAGDFAAKEFGQISMLPSDIIAYLPAAFQAIA
jgi:hydroxyethylthiazole kinase-like uncharacterized protein yjeF